MEQKARLVLEHAIKKLDEGTCPPEYVSWKAHAEEAFRSGDKEALRIIDNIMDFIIFVEQDTEATIKKMLVGTNILAPSLTNKGWKFWKPPLLKRKYRKAVKTSVVRWSQAKAMGEYFFTLLTEQAEIDIPAHQPNAQTTSPSGGPIHTHTTNQGPITHTRGKIV